MIRDSTVSLPYHKVNLFYSFGFTYLSIILINHQFLCQPKQRSLAEFLNRKRVTPKTEAHLLKARPKDLQTVV
jgi:hypothetical protein